VNTLISTGGVAVGVMALLVVLSVMSGFHEDLQKKILGVNAHVVILDYRGVLQGYEEVIGKIKGDQDRFILPVRNGAGYGLIWQRAHGALRESTLNSRKNHGDWKVHEKGKP
jgi:ABC-type lipoprotein release transport system permease subunit